MKYRILRLHQPQRERLRRLRFSYRFIAQSLAIGLIIFYFMYHMLSGEKGVLAMMQLQRQVEIAHIQRDTLNKQHAMMQKKVKSINNSSLDLDLLDEQAKRLLGHAGADEIMLPLPKSLQSEHNQLQQRIF